MDAVDSVNAVDIVDAETLVLTIGRGDEALHVGSAGNSAIHIGMGAPSKSVEYFDPTGQPLRLVRAGKGWAFAPDRTLPPVPERALLRRIDTALDNMQAVLDGNDNTQLAPDGGDKVPRPTGPLVVVLAALAAEFDDLAPYPNHGNWLHQLAHAAGLAH